MRCYMNSEVKEDHCPKNQMANINRNYTRYKITYNSGDTDINIYFSGFPES